MINLREPFLVNNQQQSFDSNNLIIGEQHKLCRVLCTNDGVSTVIQLPNNSNNLTVYQALAKIYNKKHINWYKCDLYFVDDHQLIDPYGDAIQLLSSKEIYLEERCLFVISLIPIAINLCVKANYKKTIQSIIQPILDMYQINLINCAAYLNSNASILNVSDFCSIIDNQHVFIVHKNQANLLSPSEINNFINVSISEFLPSSNNKDVLIQFDEYGILKQINLKSRIKLSKNSAISSEEQENY